MRKRCCDGGGTMTMRNVKGIGRVKGVDRCIERWR